MKKIVLSVIIAFVCKLMIAQVPELFDYKEIRDPQLSGNLLSASGNASANNDDVIIYSDSYKAGKGIITIGPDGSLGGYVFYVTPDGTHGLVAATQDQSASSDWYSAQDIISNPDNHNADGKKFTDWRLPTKYELNLIYTQKTAIGAFTNNYYWSYIGNGTTYVWLQNFGNGKQLYGPKENTYCVRAIRSF